MYTFQDSGGGVRVPTALKAGLGHTIRPYLKKKKINLIKDYSEIRTMPDIKRNPFSF